MADDFQFHPITDFVPRVGGTHRDAWLDFEVSTPQGPARASLSSETEAPLLAVLTAKGTATRDAAAFAVSEAFKAYAEKAIKQRLANGDPAPDVKVGYADAEAIAIIRADCAS